MTPAEIARVRAAAQGLSTPRRGTPAGLVEWLGAVQSQDLPVAKWSIAQRLAGGTIAAVDEALAEGMILRSHVLRPTWHFVPRDDLRWMQQLTSPRVLALMAYSDRREGVGAAMIARGMKAIAAAIDRRGHQTRAELADVLRQAGIAVNAWLVSQLVIHAELRAIVCSGIPRGKQQTYALLDERAPRSTRLTADEAGAELARRYFRSHGPATVKDFRWWSGLDATSAARAVASLGKAIEVIRVGDRSYLFARAKPPRAVSGGAHLIQAFDEITVGYSESRDVVDPGGTARARGWGLLLRGVLLGGEVIGRWSAGKSGRAGKVDVEWSRRPAAAERAAVDRAVERFAEATSAAAGRTDSGLRRSAPTRSSGRRP